MFGIISKIQYICNLIHNNYTNMEDEHFDYTNFTDDVMDSETITQDFDDIDLYGTKMVEDDEESNIEFE